MKEGQEREVLLKEQLNPEHELVKLSKLIDWEKLEVEFRQPERSEGGRRRLRTRLMVGLHYLKAMYDESDESVVSKWVENPYWQYFCGESEFQHKFPCHPTSMTKWRKRVGVEGVEKLLKEVLSTAMRSKALKASEIEKVNVDTRERKNQQAIRIWLQSSDGNNSVEQLDSGSRCSPRQSV
ncbi:MAG: transposase [Halobacteriota archaeon]|nr:transposase [Halobacteriota archaeon]